MTLRSISKALFAPTAIAVPGLLRRYLYLPSAPTQSFSGVDVIGNVLQVNPLIERTDCYINGIKLIVESDYMVATDTVDLVLGPVDDPTTVEIIVLAENRPLMPLTTVKIDTSFWLRDGINVQFPLVDANGVPIDVQSDSDLWVSVDGVIQESSVDYTTLTDQIIFAVPLLADSTVWVVAGVIGGGTGGGAGIILSPTAPPNPQNGTAWANYSGQLYIWDQTGGVWIQLSGATA